MYPHIQWRLKLRCLWKQIKWRRKGSSRKCCLSSICNFSSKWCSSSCIFWISCSMSRNFWIFYEYIFMASLSSITNQLQDSEHIKTARTQLNWKKGSEQQKWSFTRSVLTLFSLFFLYIRRSDAWKKFFQEGQNRQSDSEHGIPIIYHSSGALWSESLFSKPVKTQIWGFFGYPKKSMIRVIFAHNR